MSATLTIVLLWLAFAATHMGFSNARVRPVLVARLGERPFAGLYSLVSLAIFVPLVAVYFDNKHSGPLLWYLGGTAGVGWVMLAGAGVAGAIMAAGIARPSPASLAPGRAEVRGVYRITRHPLFMGIGLLAGLHLLVTVVNAAELAFFGGFVAFTLVGCHHQDRRKLATLGDEFRRFHAETPFLPGTRRGALRGVAEQPIPMLIGACVAAALRVFHPNLFG
jgi:uncharacterized membrane protein